MNRNLRQTILAILAWALAIATVVAQWPAQLQPWLAPQRWERDADRPIVSLGEAGQFDDMHIFAPAVAEEGGRFSLWYSGSRGTPGNRVFRLGLATSSDGRQFEKHPANPVLEFADKARSVLTPALLRKPDGSVLREEGKLRMWFAAATLGKGGLHTLHEASSDDGIHWTEPSPVLLENVYCPTVLKTDDGYRMWFSDVSRRPWVIRTATSTNGREWKVVPRPALVLSQDWEAEVLVYPTVLMADGAYLMWYGSYDQAVRRETTAIGFAASLDGEHWQKHPQNPVLRPDPARPWESNYVGSGSVVRLPDGSFRYWYASRKAPPFLNLYFAINTARWSGPAATSAAGLLALPPRKGDKGLLATDAALGRSLTVLEVIDQENLIARAWYLPEPSAGKTATANDATFVDLWLSGIDTQTLAPDAPLRLSTLFEAVGNRLIDTDCGKRSFAELAAVKP